MDQEIEVRAKDFLAFLERCSKQDRAAATASIASCLLDLEAFLEQIQPMLRMDNKTTNQRWNQDESHDTTLGPRVNGLPSLLYPTLGPLLYRLCMNPVVLTSRNIEGLLIRTLIGYSCQSWTRADPGWTPRQRQLARERKTKAEAWCTARLKDMFLTDRDPNAEGSNLTPHVNLFQVSTEEMRGLKSTDLFSTLGSKLRLIVEALTKSDEAPAHSKAMACWIFGLSGLCTPLVGDVRSHALVAGVIELAYRLSSMELKRGRKTYLQQLLDPTFVDNIMKQQDSIVAAPYCLENKQLMKLWCISPIARQQTIVRCITRSLEAFAGHQSLLTLDLEDVLQKHAENSCFLVAMTKMWDMGCCPVELFLQNLTEIAADVPDWRISRLCTLLVEWTLQNWTDFGDNTTATSEGDALMEILLVVRSLLGRTATTADLDFMDTTLTQWQEAVRNYVIQSSGPRELSLRRRLVFLVGAACWSHDRLLMRLTFQYFKEQDSRQLGQNESSVAPVIIAELFLGFDTDCQTTMVHQVQHFLNEVRGIGSAYCRDKESPKALEAHLSSKLENFRSTLALNTVVLADLICALGLYMVQGDPIPWQTMLAVVRTTIYPSATLPMFAATPFMVRLCDIQRSSPLPGMREAIESILEPTV